MDVNAAMVNNKTRLVVPAEKDLVVMEARKKELMRGILIFWLVSTVFLFLRIILAALGSDPQASFAALVYTVSGIFLLPFYGIFPRFRTTLQSGDPTFDVTSIVAIFCYSVILLLLALLVTIFTKMVKTRKQVTETVESGRPVDPTKSEQIVK